MRVKRGFAGRRRHNRLRQEAKGFRGRRKTCITFMETAVNRSMKNQYIGRKRRKRDFRALWIVRINAAARLCGGTYRELIHGLRVTGIELNRKVLAELAMNDLDAFRSVANQAFEGARRAQSIAA
jgi:large subunit ribosomal protein L20